MLLIVSYLAVMIKVLNAYMVVLKILYLRPSRNNETTPMHYENEVKN